MGTVWVREFTGGLDARRLPETTAGGVLIRARNGHISRGGEFEKRAAFALLAALALHDKAAPDARFRTSLRLIAAAATDERYVADLPESDGGAVVFRRGLVIG